MRNKDRIEAFKYLLQNKDKYPSEEAYLFNFFQALIKLTSKGLLSEVIKDIYKDKLLFKTFIESLLDEKNRENL